MASGIKSGGTDIDTIFEPKGTATAATTNIQDDSGNDLKLVYADISEGTGPTAITNWKVGGSDLNTIFVELGGGTPTVSPVGDGQQTSVDGLTGNCYAGVQFHSNGYEYERDASTGAFDINKGLWLNSGSADKVWVEYDPTSGSFNENSPGSGRHNLASPKEWSEYRLSAGTSTTTGTFRMWDTAGPTGGTEIGTSANATWSCQRVQPVISMSSASITRTSTAGTTYAGLRFNALGSERENIATGVNNTTYNVDHGDGTWLDSGGTQSNSDVWISREINSGNLDFDSGGTTTAPLWMNLQRSYGVTDSTAGTGAEVANITFKMWDSSAGSGYSSPAIGQLGSSATVAFSADYESSDSVLLDTAWILNNHDAGNTSVCSVTFASDGSISTVNNGGSDTLPASDNWWTANPSTGIGASYEVAYTSIGTGGFTTGPAINVWTAMTTGVQYLCRVIGKASPATVAANNVTFAIRPAGGGATLDSIAGCYHAASN